jgi:phosphoglycolate phosphatase
VIRLFVFDLDGTLVDSLQDLADSANALLVECGASPLPEEAVARMVGDGAAVLVQRAFSAAGVPKPPDALARFLTCYDARLLRHTRPYPGIPDVLRELGARAPLAVLTNKPLEATGRILTGLDLLQHFRGGVFGGDGPFPRKPDPTALRTLAADAGVTAAETILVGDSAIDWQTAHNGGTRVCLVRYGFGFAGVSRGDLGTDDLVVDVPGDLLRL